MAEIKWIKLLIDTFEDEKIKLIQTTMPDGDALVLIWLRLLCQAGKCNAGGYVYLSESMPYSSEMLAALFGKPASIVEFALRTYQAFGMIDIDERGFIWIENWERHQNVDGMERAKKLKSERQKRWRDKQKKLNPPKTKKEPSTEPSTETTTETLQETLQETRNDALERRKKKEEVELEKDIKQLSSNLDDIAEILLFLNEKADRSFGNSQTNRKEIQARMNRGAKIEECKLVIDWKVSQWKHDAMMKKNLNPATLFRASNFDRYLDEAREELTNRGENVERILSGYREDQTNSPFAAQAKGGMENAKDRGRDGQRSKATAGHSAESRRIAEIAKRDGYLSDSLHDPEYDF